jgi:hypothetical protein
VVVRDRGLWIGALGLTAGLFALRWWLAGQLGFADAEALYASYAMHPQPAYLDHPGLVSAVMQLLGGGTAPSPTAAHRFAAVVATVLPWLGAWAARATGASPRGALRTCLGLSLVPEIAVGLFAVNPDLLLAVFWLAALGCAGLALRSPPGSLRALVATLGAGASVGMATLSKVSGVLLGAALLGVLLGRGASERRRTVAPWAALAVALLLVAPVALWELSRGFPMLHHRLVATQASAGWSLRNAGALVGGQLLYVTPPFLFAAWQAHRALRARREPELRLLLAATWWPAVPLVLLCLWSRVAEPHWLAPAYLGLAVGVAHVDHLKPWVARSSVVVGLAVVAGSALWVGTDLPPRLLGSGYRARYDLANDLHVWQRARSALEEALADARRDGPEPVVVGPHWVVCAQLQATLGAGVQVGCRTPEGDDFDGWLPRARWHASPTLVYVGDDRFQTDPATEFPSRRVVDDRRLTVRRGGRAVRTLRISTLGKASDVARAPDAQK